LRTWKEISRSTGWVGLYPKVTSSKATASSASPAGPAGAASVAAGAEAAASLSTSLSTSVSSRSLKIRSAPLIADCSTV
jgi:hypothetical protein